MNLSHLSRAFSLALFFPEMREFIQQGNRLLANLREHGNDYEAVIATVEQVIDKLWERNLSKASELIESAETPQKYRLCDFELLCFKIALCGRASSIGGLPLGVH